MESNDFFNSMIKLLIGALFGGLSVYFVLREKLSQANSTGTQRKIALVEQVAQHVGKVSHVFSKYSSLINDIGPNVDRVSVKQHQELDALSTELVDVYQEISIAESKLLLLGEKRLEKALKLYTAKMAQYRKQFYPGRYKHQDEATTVKKEITQMREQFYDILSERYDATIN